MEFKVPMRVYKSPGPSNTFFLRQNKQLLFFKHTKATYMPSSLLFSLCGILDFEIFICSNISISNITFSLSFLKLEFPVSVTLPWIFYFTAISTIKILPFYLSIFCLVTLEGWNKTERPLFCPLFYSQWLGRACYIVLFGENLSASILNAVTLNFETAFEIYVSEFYAIKHI